MAVAASTPVRAYPLGQGSYRGISWGPGNPSLQVQTWQDDALPDLTTNDVKKSHAAGDWSGEDYLNSRLLQVTFVAMGRDNIEYRQLLHQLETQWLPGTTDQLLFMDRTRILNVRLRKRLFEHFLGGRGDHGLVHIEWYAADPMEYDATPGGSGQITLMLGSLDIGGRVYDLVFDREYPFSAGEGVGVANNTGNFPSLAWRLRIFGPCTNPRVYNETLDLVMSFTGVLQSGEYLDCDALAGTIWLNSNPATSRYTWLDLPQSQWWPLMPGSNAIRFTADAVDPGAQAVLSWNSTIA
ncbi:MAG: hypothetical protein J2P57_21345, partial [Acidimicrobiaceae bacterium]|nr:hypothetical protein [Acidimicrobiaceae bacterium]